MKFGCFQFLNDASTVSVLIPFPNTPRFQRLEREGRTLTYDWEKYNGKKVWSFSRRA